MQITITIHVNVGQLRQPRPPWVLSASWGHQPSPARADPLSCWTSQQQGKNSPCTIGSFFTDSTSCVLITDKAIRRLQIQQSPGQKTTVAGEPPSTSANAFAACAGRHPTALLSAQGKHALTPCQPPEPGSPKEPWLPRAAHPTSTARRRARWAHAIPPAIAGLFSGRAVNSPGVFRTGRKSGGASWSPALTQLKMACFGRDTYRPVPEHGAVSSYVTCTRVEFKARAPQDRYRRALRCPVVFSLTVNGCNMCHINY